MCAREYFRDQGVFYGCQGPITGCQRVFFGGQGIVSKKPDILFVLGGGSEEGLQQHSWDTNSVGRVVGGSC